MGVPWESGAHAASLLRFYNWYLSSSVLLKGGLGRAKKDVPDVFQALVTKWKYFENESQAIKVKYIFLTSFIPTGLKGMKNLEESTGVLAL